MMTNFWSSSVVGRGKHAKPVFCIKPGSWVALNTNLYCIMWFSISNFKYPQITHFSGSAAKGTVNNDSNDKTQQIVFRPDDPELNLVKLN